MWDKHLVRNLIIIAAVVGFGALVLSQKRLRGGLDIEGGASMIFEINDEGVEGNQQLAEQMKDLLSKRVDPQGVYNLSWRPMGRNRLEVSMPLPPKEVAQYREAYNAAQRDLYASNLQPSEVEAALREPAEQRPAALQKLANGSQQRLTLLQQAAERYDAYLAALEKLRAAETSTQPTTQPDAEQQKQIDALELAVRDAQEVYEDALDAVQATNLNPADVQQLLDLDPKSTIRKNGLEELKRQHPELADKIDALLAAHAKWQENRGYLDGPADLRRLIKGAGVLEFRIMAEPNPDNPTQFDALREQLQERGPNPRRGDKYGWFKIDNPVSFLNLNSPGELENVNLRANPNYVIEKYRDAYYALGELSPSQGLLHDSGRKWRLKRALGSRDTAGRPSVAFQLDAVGGNLFRDLTRRNVKRSLGIFVDNVLYSAPSIREAIGASGEISGDFSAQKINYLVNTMQAGALPARLKETPISERTIGSSLGEVNRDMALRAGMISMIAIIIFMILVYLMNGVIADIALLLNIVLVLAAMALVEARFTLAGIAGVILTIGMAVDANVLILERMREEKERGASLKMIIKNGYDKAFSTIIDSNITTLLTSIIIYYVGSEEIKGFGLTLAFGIVISLFTALFVTRTLYTLMMRFNMMKDIHMLRLFSGWTVDWYGKRKLFYAISAIVIVLGMASLYFRGTRDVLDVEFLGGVNAEVALKPDAIGKITDAEISKQLTAVGRRVADEAGALASADVQPVAGEPATFRVTAGSLDNDLLAAFIREPLEQQGLLTGGGVDPHAGGNGVVVRLGEERDAQALENIIQGLASQSEEAGQNLAQARVNSVLDIANPSEKGEYWNITTTVTNKQLVQYALVSAIGDDLEIQPKINFILHSTTDGLPYPITSRRLEGVLPPQIAPEGVGADLTDYMGGALMVFDDLEPPQTLPAIETRLANMRLQPGYQDLPYRSIKVIGLKPVAGSGSGDNAKYSEIAVAVADQNYPFSDDRDRWASELARPELKLAEATFDNEQTLRKVTQFKPEIAGQSQRRAIVALLLSWAMIIAYLWIRFGSVRYGVGGVVALVHDVLVALGFIGFAGYLGATAIGKAMLLEGFKIDMTLIAALLTIIGYSINDTIVIFDRIRETRGRLGAVTPQIINDSINACMSRTILTGGTTLIVLIIMYIFGGSSIRGFNFVMSIGVITGTYSSIAVACPILLAGMAQPRGAGAGRAATAG